MGRRHEGFSAAGWAGVPGKHRSRPSGRIHFCGVVNLSYIVPRPCSWVWTLSLSLRGPRTGWGSAPAAARPLPRAHAGHQVRGGWRWVSALSRAAGAEGLVGGYGVRLGGAGQSDARGPSEAAPTRPHHSSAACVQELIGWGQAEAVHLLPARAHLMLPGLCPVLAVGGAGPHLC